MLDKTRKPPAVKVKVTAALGEPAQQAAWSNLWRKLLAKTGERITND